MASIDPVPLPILDKEPAPKLARSRRSKWRFLVLLIIQALIILHVVQWYLMGTTTTPIEPSEAMSTVKEGVITVGTIFFSAAILSTLIFGRYFCGWGCHVILLQDFCGSILKKFGIRPKPFRSRLLIWLPLGLALYMFVWPLFYRYAIAPWMNIELVPMAFRWELTTTQFWATFPGIMMAIPFLLVCGFLTVYVLGMKGYCTYGCPYGGIFAPAEQVAPVRIRVTDDCKHCGHCTAACTSNVRVHEEVWTHGMVVDPGCMKCMDCVSVCPNDALYAGFGKPAVAVPSSERKTGKKRTFDLSWTEEIAIALIAIVTLFSLRGAYSLPLLFASGVAGVATWILWKAWRVLRDPNVSFHRTRLKYHGKFRPVGIAFVVFAGVVLLVIAETGVVNFIALQANRFHDRVLVPPQAVFTEDRVVIPEEMSLNAEKAIEYYDLAGFVGDGGWSLIPSKRDEFATRKAWLLAVLQRYEEGLVAIEGIIARRGMNEDLAMQKGQLLLVIEPTRIDDWYGEILDEHPTWTRLREDRIRLRTQRNDLSGAYAEARVGYEANPDDLLSMRRLAVILLDHGGFDDWVESARITERTLEIDPENAGAWRALALAKAKLMQYQDAQQAMERAVELAPNDFQMRSHYVRLLNDLGLRNRAITEHAEAIRLWEEQGEVGSKPILPDPPPVGPLER